MKLDPQLVAARQARITYEDAEAALQAFLRTKGRPGTISGEKLTAADHVEFQALLATERAAWDEYRVLRGW